MKIKDLRKVNTEEEGEFKLRDLWDALCDLAEATKEYYSEDESEDLEFNRKLFPAYFKVKDAIQKLEAIE